MADVIKMQYPLMEEMAKTLKQSAEQCEDTMKEMKAVASMLSGGALLGQGGTTMTEAIEGSLCNSLRQLQAMFLELEKDVLMAMADMQKADETSAKLYTGS